MQAASVQEHRKQAGLDAAETGRLRKAFGKRVLPTQGSEPEISAEEQANFIKQLEGYKHEEIALEGRHFDVRDANAKEEKVNQRLLFSDADFDVDDRLHNVKEAPDDNENACLVAAIRGTTLTKDERKRLKKLAEVIDKKDAEKEFLL